MAMNGLSVLNDERPAAASRTPEPLLRSNVCFQVVHFQVHQARHLVIIFQMGTEVAIRFEAALANLTDLRIWGYIFDTQMVSLSRFNMLSKRNFKSSRADIVECVNLT